MARHNKRFTIYDMLEERGYFEQNPANLNARDSTGLSIYKKQEYPKMLYHPEGAERITRAATAISTPFGPQWVGEEKELIHKLVNSVEEEKEALANGWHLQPRSAIAVRAKTTGEALPPQSREEIVSNAQADEIELLKKKLAAAEIKLAAREMDNSKRA